MVGRNGLRGGFFCDCRPLCSDVVIIVVVFVVKMDFVVAVVVVKIDLVVVVSISIVVFVVVTFVLEIC